jgi:hypothetical protein
MTTSISDAFTQETAPPRLEAAVTMESESHFFALPNRDAPQGVFVATPRELAIGQRVRVELGFHAYFIVFRGTVRWRRASGVGISFDALSGPAKQVIESFCARRRPPVICDAEGNPAA